jgi:hypothetical protein
MPHLRKLKLPIADHDERIRRDQLYLVKYDGRWDIGKFSEQWYGWNFGGFYDAGLQVHSEGWQKCYEFHE